MSVCRSVSKFVYGASHRAARMREVGGFDSFPLLLPLMFELWNEGKMALWESVRTGSRGKER